MTTVYLDDSQLLARVVASVASLSGISAERITSATHAPDVAHARWCVWWLLRRQAQWTLKRIAIVCKVNHATVLKGEAKANALAVQRDHRTRAILQPANAELSALLKGQTRKRSYEYVMSYVATWPKRDAKALADALAAHLAA